MSEKSNIILICLGRDCNNIKLDDIHMVTTDREELKTYIETAITMIKTLYKMMSKEAALLEFRSNWEVMQEMNTVELCSFMTDCLSDIHLQVWFDGEKRGGRLYE